MYAISCCAFVEVSRHQDGGFWVEFWNSFAEDGQPEAGATFSSRQALEEWVLEWSQAKSANENRNAHGAYPAEPRICGRLGCSLKDRHGRGKR